MKLNKHQFKFSSMVPLLILYIYQQGYTISIGDVYAKSGHKRGSNHYKKLAIDINLFKDGKYLRSTDAHAGFGFFWETLHPLNRWGGRFKDGNHYEYVIGGWR
jgi:hypothetical protein